MMSVLDGAGVASGAASAAGLGPAGSFGAGGGTATLSPPPGLGCCLEGMPLSLRPLAVTAITMLRATATSMTAATAAQIGASLWQRTMAALTLLTHHCSSVLLTFRPARAGQELH